MTAEPRVRSGTVLLPAYNEASVVASSVRAVAATLSSTLADRDWEIVVIDDGSADGTADRAAAVGAEVDRCGLRVRVLRHPENRGLGAAITTGFAHSTGDVVVVMDCDLSYAPGHIPLLVRALEAGSAQVAVASPYMPGGSTVNVPRHIERRSRLANRFIASASKIQLSTYTGVVRAYDGAFIRRLSVKHSDQRVNVEIVYKAHVLNARIIEVPATLDWSGLAHRGASLRNHDRRIRSATYRTVLDGVLFRPYLLFLAGGAALFALGLLLAAVPLAATGPAVHLGMVLIGAGVLLAMSSLLSIQVKRCFEELYFQQYTERAAVPHVAAPPVSPLYPVEIVRVGER